MKVDRIRTTIYLNRAVRDNLRLRALKQHISLAEYIRRAVTAYVAGKDVKTP